MSMKIQSVFDPAFARYGKVLKGFDLEALKAALMKTECPAGGTAYVASDPELEKLPVFETFSAQVYGGMPVQIGHCNGENYKLNCLEYHRDSEVNLPVGSDMILLLGLESDIDFENYEYDTAKVEAFRVPEGTLVEVYGTSLHYAPVGKAFRSLVVLPRGTNTELKFKPEMAGDARLLTATNKWLLAHAESNEAKNGAMACLKGENWKIEL